MPRLPTSHPTTTRWNSSGAQTSPAQRLPAIRVPKTLQLSPVQKRARPHLLRLLPPGSGGGRGSHEYHALSTFP
eukprot:9282140-Alexandrium_andersonii.AAC.1